MKKRDFVFKYFLARAACYQTAKEIETNADDIIARGLEFYKRINSCPALANEKQMEEASAYYHALTETKQ